MLRYSFTPREDRWNRDLLRIGYLALSAMSSRAFGYFGRLARLCENLHPSRILRPIPRHHQLFAKLVFLSHHVDALPRHDSPSGELSAVQSSVRMVAPVASTTAYSQSHVRFQVPQSLDSPPLGHLPGLLMLPKLFRSSMVPFAACRVLHCHPRHGPLPGLVHLAGSWPNIASS